ncbi:MAG: T9SS type A sorting domain-containing protein [Ignavibacteriales bacterium]|nr:T9SS type A sorting domain-containing protein [Ignavibacteriales bacterium]
MKAIGKNIHLTWSTATETNNAGFEIERQDKTGNAWSKIAFIEGHGTTSSPKEYSYVDSKVSGGNYSYRLKQVDRDGKFEYSQSVEVNIGLTAEDFQLSQNYPNPFNPSTQIQFAVPQSEFVSLRVYNTLGQEVRTLFNGIAEGNTMQKVEFDGSTLPSGVYFYSLKTKDRHEVKKLSLMK